MTDTTYLAVIHPLEMPLSARYVAIHWIVLTLLNAPGAQEGLDAFLMRYLHRCVMEEQVHGNVPEGREPKLDFHSFPFCAMS